MAVRGGGGGGGAGDKLDVDLTVSDIRRRCDEHTIVTQEGRAKQ